jgi:hypothetical protein
MHWKLKYKSRGKVEMQIGEQKEEKEKRIKNVEKELHKCISIVGQEICQDFDVRTKNETFRFQSFYSSFYRNVKMASIGEIILLTVSN